MKKTLYFSAVLAMSLTVMGGFASCSSDNEEIVDVEAPVAEPFMLDVEFEQPTDPNGTRVGIDGLKLSLEDGDLVYVTSATMSEKYQFLYHAATNKLELLGYHSAARIEGQIAYCGEPFKNYGYDFANSPNILSLSEFSENRSKASSTKLPSASIIGRVNNDGTAIKFSCIDAIIKVKFSELTVSTLRDKALYFVPNEASTRHPIHSINAILDYDSVKDVYTPMYDSSNATLESTGYYTINQFDGEAIPVAGVTYYFAVMPFGYVDGYKLIYGDIDADGQPAAPCLYREKASSVSLKAGKVYNAGTIDLADWTKVGY